MFEVVFFVIVGVIFIISSLLQFKTAIGWANKSRQMQYFLDHFDEKVHIYVKKYTGEIRIQLLEEFEAFKLMMELK